MDRLRGLKAPEPPSGAAIVNRGAIWVPERVTSFRAQDCLPSNISDSHHPRPENPCSGTGTLGRDGEESTFCGEEGQAEKQGAEQAGED